MCRKLLISILFTKALQADAFSMTPHLDPYQFLVLSNDMSISVCRYWTEIVFPVSIKETTGNAKPRLSYAKEVSSSTSFRKSLLYCEGGILLLYFLLWATERTWQSLINYQQPQCRSLTPSDSEKEFTYRVLIYNQLFVGYVKILSGSLSCCINSQMIHCSIRRF
jgi:hypothetical protein